MLNKGLQLRQRLQLGLLTPVPAVCAVGNPVQKRAQAKRGDKPADAVVVQLLCYVFATLTT